MSPPVVLIVAQQLYRGLFVDGLRTAYDQGELEFPGQLEELSKPKNFNRLLRKLSKIEWVVQAKRPFGGPEKVVDYLGRYTHKVAISNHRLLKLEDGRVSFRWRNYRQAKEGTGKALQIMTLEADEFIRRFLLHVLPRGFVRIRRYGLLANRQRGANLARARELLDAAPPVTEEPLDWEDLYRKLTGRSIGGCRKCGQGQMSTVERIPSLWERLQELRLGVHQPLNPVSRALAALYLQRVRQLENELIRVMTKAVATVPGIDSS